MEKKFFRLPDELPAGFFEAVKPFADWAKKAMCEAYQAGYFAGKADASTEWKEILDRTRKDDQRKKPPTGAAPVCLASLSLS